MENNIYVDHQKKRTYPVSSRNMIYLKIVAELKTKFHLYMRKTRSSSSSSRTWHTAAVVSKELISRNSSFRGWCEMVLHSFVFDLLFKSAKDSPEQNFFVIFSLSLHAHLLPFSLLLSTLLPSQCKYQIDEQNDQSHIFLFLFS